MFKTLMVLVGAVLLAGCTTGRDHAASLPHVDTTNSVGMVMVDSPDLPFLIAQTETTQAQWEQIMPVNPSRRKGPQRPVECVTVAEAAWFCDSLSKKEGRHYRLPTEKEWDEACTTGTDTNVELDAWCYPYSSGPRDVATKKADRHGVYDLYGNVNEWCLADLSDWDALLKIPRLDYSYSCEADQVAKGGSYLFGPLQCGTEGRVEYGRGLRCIRAPDIGFRVIRER
jgi:formylglycine-generating enzyme required for sulfatase activity